MPSQGSLSFLSAAFGLLGKRLAAERIAVEGAMLVVAKPGFVVGEEHPADQLPPAANVGLLEDLLGMLLNRVRGNDEALGDLGG